MHIRTKVRCPYGTGKVLLPLYLLLLYRFTYLLTHCSTHDGGGAEGGAVDGYVGKMC